MLHIQKESLFALLLLCVWSVEAASTSTSTVAKQTSGSNSPWWQLAVIGGIYFLLYAVPFTIFVAGAVHFKRMWKHIHAHHERRHSPTDLTAFKHWTTYPYTQNTHKALAVIMEMFRGSPRLVPGPGSETHSVLWSDVEFVKGPQRHYTRNRFGGVLAIILFCLAPTLGALFGGRIAFLGYTFFIAWNIPGLACMIALLASCRSDLRAAYNRQIAKNIFVVTTLGACTFAVEKPKDLQNVVDFEEVRAGTAELCAKPVVVEEPAVVVPVVAVAQAPAAANPAPAAADAPVNADAPANADAAAADNNDDNANANDAAAPVNADAPANADAAPVAVVDVAPELMTSVRVQKLDGSYVYICHDVMHPKECVEAINVALALRDRSRLVTVDLVLDCLQQRTVGLPALAVERIMSFLPDLDDAWTRKKQEARKHGGRTEITNAQGEIVWRFDTHVEEAIQYTPSLPAASYAAAASPAYAYASGSGKGKGRRDEDIEYIVPEMDHTTMMTPVPASPALMTLMPHLDAMMHTPDLRYRSPAIRQMELTASRD